MKIIHVVGARPNFMKAAPLLQALAEESIFQNLLVHTGQHYDDNMSAIFFRELHLPAPDLNLEVGSASHAVQTAEIMVRFEQVLQAEKPDLVVVFGDVNSTVACSLVAAKLGIPVAHVEAGLRSFDRTMPEEINRVVTDALSELLFAPSQTAVQNLQREGVATDKVFFVGNLMVDTLLQAVPVARARCVWQRYSLQPGSYAVVTMHRVSNVDDATTLKGLLEMLRTVGSRLPLLFPMHPRTVARLAGAGFTWLEAPPPGLIITEPLGYLDFLSLVSEARLVLSDSGSLQAETTVLGVPCLTMRTNTEWPETMSDGSNQLVGSDPSRILLAADRVLSLPKPKAARPAGWDGMAAGRVKDVLLTWARR